VSNKRGTLHGTLSGALSAINIADFSKYNDDNFAYFDARKWTNTINKNQPWYMAIEKRFLDGKEYETKSLLNGIEPPYGVFLLSKT